jgi:hypothetical protein
MSLVFNVGANSPFRFAAISLALRNLLLRLRPLIRGQGFPHVYRLSERPFGLSPDKALVALFRFNDLSFAGFLPGGHNRKWLPLDRTAWNGGCRDS